MVGKHVLKPFAGVVFTCILIYQMVAAIQTYVSRPTSSYTRWLHFRDIHPKPIITICKKNQFRLQKSFDLGYNGLRYLLAGLPNKTGQGQFVSWGAQHNMTFDEVVDYIYGEDNTHISLDVFNIAKKEMTNMPSKNVFLANWGKCTQYNAYTDNIVSVTFSGTEMADQDEYCILLTGYTESTSYNIADMFTEGDKLCFTKKSAGYIYYNIVQVNLKETISDCDPQHKLCLKDHAWQAFEDVGCHPPWLKELQSDMESCDGIVLNSSQTARIMKTFAYEEAYSLTSGLAICTSYCLKPCRNTGLKIISTSATSIETQDLIRVDLFFEEFTSLESERYSYHEFNLLVEFGSALGLWVGFSAMDLFCAGLDLADLVHSKVLKLWKRK